jgi:hypothetical protein
MREANELIKPYIVTNKKPAFIDIHSSMIESNYVSCIELYAQDGIQLNREAYRLAKHLITPYLPTFVQLKEC